MQFSGKWMDLEAVIPRTIAQTQKDTLRVFSPLPMSVLNTHQAILQDITVLFDIAPTFKLSRSCLRKFKRSIEKYLSRN